MRKGLGLNQGKGYYNLVPKDPYIHSLSARGVKTDYLGSVIPSTKSYIPHINAVVPTEIVPEKRAKGDKVVAYDNGGKTFDRYTYIVGKDVFGASDNPNHPQGFSQYVGEIDEFPKPYNFGKRISPKSLPDAVKKDIKDRTGVTVNAKGKKCLDKYLKPVKPNQYFDKRLIEQGIKVEMEHTNNRSVARRIALAHLNESKIYYYQLAKMEKSLKAKGWVKRDARNTFADYYWTTPDSSLTISHNQDRDGKNAFVYSVTANTGLSSIGKYPSNLKKKIIWEGRSEKLAIQKAKQYMVGR